MERDAQGPERPAHQGDRHDRARRRRLRSECHDRRGQRRPHENRLFRHSNRRRRNECRRGGAVLKRWDVPALLWAIVVCALVLHSGYLWFGKRLAPDPDILALLPTEQRDATVRQAFNQTIDAATQRVIVLIGADDWSAAKHAADAYESVLAGQTRMIEPIAAENAADSDIIKMFYGNRLGLLAARAGGA